jgi:chloride channel 7
MQPCPPDAGEDCPRTDNSHSGNFVSFNCAHRPAYNDLATIFFNTQDDAIRNLFSSQTKNEYSVSTLLTFVVMFFFLAVVSYGVAIPTGLFVPSILCGAAYGRLVGVFVADMHPGTHAIDEGTYALLGAASFLGGCMRMTVATCVMLLELTSNLALLPMMMLVTLVAKVRQFCHVFFQMCVFLGWSLCSGAWLGDVMCARLVQLALTTSAHFSASQPCCSQRVQL